MDVPEFTITKLSQLHLVGPNVPVTVDGRVHKILPGHPYSVTSIVLRHDGHFVTAVLQTGITDRETVDKANSLTVESILRVRGMILQNQEDLVNGSVSTPTKMQIFSLTILSEAKENIPSGLISHDGPGDVPNSQEMNGALINQRLDNRVIDVRVAATAAIFKLFSSVHQLTVEHLSEYGFQWMASPKLISYQIPGDNDYFEVPYMNGQRARLTQTSEFHLSLALAADLERVYDIYTVFRREPAISTRHLTEFTMVEVCFALKDGWVELLEGVENLIIYLLKSLKEQIKYQALIAQASRLYPLAGDLQLGLNEQGRLLRITFSQAKKILRETLGVDTYDTKDLTTEEEAALGRYLSSESSCLGLPSDVFVITHYPKNIRPYNYHPSDDDPENATNSFDIIIRGQECCTSAQLIHSYDGLRAAMTKRDPPIDPDSPEWSVYTAAHEAGMPPWGGYGLGLNRFVQGFLGLQDVHETVLFPRDASRLNP